MAETAIRATVTGKVQGVAYRDFVRREAETRHVRGWVRNAAEGHVEAVLAGEALDIEKVVQAMRKGPPGAEVADIETAPEDTEAATGCKDLVIRD